MKASLYSENLIKYLNFLLGISSGTLIYNAITNDWDFVRSISVIIVLSILYFALKIFSKRDKSVLLIFGLAAVSAFGWEPSADFLNYIKKCEGFRSTPYYCPAGQLTVGYGHAIKSGEFFTYISEEDAEDLLKRDLKKAYAQVCKQTGFELEGEIAEILVDFQFNLGSLRKFPKLTGACLNNDYETISKEYKRHAGGRELTGRNRAFKNRYLSGNKFYNE